MLRLLFALALGPAVQIDATQLDPSIGGTALHGQVLERVLEAGHTLRPHAAIVVTLRTEDGVLIVRVDAGDERSEERIELGDRPPAVLALDVSHRVVALIEAHADTSAEPREASEPSERGPQPHTVALSPSIADAPLRRELLRSLSAQDFAIVPTATDAEWVVCGSQTDDDVRIAFGTEAAPCVTQLDSVTPHAELETSLTHAWTRARWPDSPSPEPAPTTHDDPVPPPPTADAPPPAAAPPSQPRPRVPWVTDVYADVGIGIRPAVDGRYGLGLALGPARGPSGHVELAVLPSGGDAELQVIDTVVAAGFGWRFPIARQWSVVPAAVIGARVHVFRFPESQARANVDPYVAIPVRVQWSPKKRPRLLLGLRIAPAFDGRPRTHRVNGAQAWQRGPWRGDVGVSIGLRLPPQRGS